MTATTHDALRQAKCAPCEGGVSALERPAAQEYLSATPDWTMDESAKSIRREIKCKNFADALERIQRIGALAEAEQHHPDLHLTGYNRLRVELTTHAIGGLSENDFILAAKIDEAL